MNTVKVMQETRRSRTAEVHFQPEYKENEYKVGDGATILYYSDREPVTIVDISDNGKVVTVQMDKATRVDNNGMSDCQDYIYERDKDGRIEIFKRNRKGFYTDNGRSTGYGTRLSFGWRNKYFDYSF